MPTPFYHATLAREIRDDEMGPLSWHDVHVLQAWYPQSQSGRPTLRRFAAGEACYVARIGSGRREWTVILPGDETIFRMTTRAARALLRSERVDGKPVRLDADRAAEAARIMDELRIRNTPAYCGD